MDVIVMLQWFVLQTFCSVIIVRTMDVNVRYIDVCYKHDLV